MLSRLTHSLSLKSLVLSGWITLTCTTIAWAQDQQQDLEAISGLRQTALEALNNQDFDKIEPFLHPQFTITTVDNQIFQTADQFEAYWEQQLAGPIERIELSLQPDGDTLFLSDQVGVNHGAASSTFYFRNGPERDMQLRWSSVVQKDGDQWLLQSLHFSANLFDNPVLQTTRRLTLVMSTGTALGGAFLGVLLTFMVRRRFR